MSGEMKKVIFNMIKYDFILCFIFVLILSLILNLKVALIFLLGLMVSLVNTIINGLVIEYSLIKNKKVLLVISYIVRILIIVLIAVPFMREFIDILSYISGYISHLLFLLIYWVKNEKGSD